VKAPGSPREIRFADAEELNLQYRGMLESLARSRYPGALVPQLAQELTKQGEAARAWIARQGDDLSAKQRREEREFLSDMDNMRRTARRLAKYMQRYPGLIAIALADARDTSRIPWRPSERSAGDTLAALLLAFADILPQKHTAQRGPFLHRVNIGPFLFKEPVDGGRGRARRARFEPATAVVFGAVLTARKISVGGYPAPGCVMPKEGQSLYAVAAALAKAATGKELTEEVAKRRLES